MGRSSGPAGGLPFGDLLEQAAGGWARFHLVRVPQSQSPARATSRFLPEQACLDVGRIQARALLAWASAFLVKSFVEAASGFVE